MSLFILFIADTEDDVHSLLITIRKEPLGCKLEIDDRMVEQIMEFNYLGVKHYQFRKYSKLATRSDFARVVEHIIGINMFSLS